MTRETRQSIARIEDLAGKPRAFADILIPAAARKLIASSDKNAAVGLLGAVAELISHTAIAASGPVVAVPGRTYRQQRDRVILAAREKVDAGEAISIDAARTHASSQRHRYNADPLAMIVARRLAARRQRRDDNQAVALAIMADVDRLCRAPYCQRLILALSRLRKFDGGCVAAYGSLARRLMATALLLAEIGHLTPLDALGVKGATVCGASPAAIVSAVEDALSPFALSALFEATNAIYESLAPSR